MERINWTTCRQKNKIRRAERKGYEPCEIMDAVVEALPAGSEFRSVLKSLESGLSNERIVTQLLPLFSQANVSDAILKQEMSKVMRSCTLRKDKKQNVRVAAVNEENGGTVEGSAKMNC
jgi:hypothetical protein